MLLRYLRFWIDMIWAKEEIPIRGDVKRKAIWCHWKICSLWRWSAGESECTDASCGLSTSHYDMGYHQRKKSRLKPEFKDSIIMDHDQTPLARWSTKISAADYQNTIKLLSVWQSANIASISKQNISKITMEGAPWLVFPQFYGRACGRTNINWTGSTTSDSPDCCPAALLESSCIYNTTYK